MNFPNVTNKPIRIAILAVIIAAAIIAWVVLIPPSTSIHDANEPPTNTTSESQQATNALPSALPAPANDHLASITVIMLNNGKQLPLKMKVGDKYIKIPGPSSWPKSDESEAGRFLAGIVDTSDILKANGYKPTDTYSLVVGGTALNASNTFRVTGNHQQNLTGKPSDGYTEEFHTRANEEGIWRSLKFKNIVVSYGQVPSLEDFLVTPQPVTHTQTAPTLSGTRNSTASELYYQNPAEMAIDTKKADEATQKYRDALNDTNPATRAQGIKDLVLYGDDLPADNSHSGGIASYIDKALMDKDTIVREAALNSLDSWDGDIPLQTLSRVVLNDESPEIRLHALSSLTDRFSDRAIPVLQQASHDPDSRVAEKARQLLDEYTP